LKEQFLRGTVPNGTNKEYLMNVLIVGYSPDWKARVMGALPKGCVTFIRRDYIQAIEVQEDVEGFNLYVLGNQLIEHNDAGLLLLQEARGVKDTTPTIIFSDRVSSEVHAEIKKLGGVWIDSSQLGADELLTTKARELLTA
jgi:hypothetical protein